jgi:hypothetical protein
MPTKIKRSTQLNERLLSTAPSRVAVDFILIGS